ncbi:MAG TPA: hypothetical protein IAB73_06600 [Candidatus Onthenecus intestinigallinarum]|uniref:Uncharacterized protein n=1 Tax=Candidatus Onthenecus intestinigallinarum TaxID=2840875 RepID=A0A9D1CQQ6_9FIRM|nr:hypothetical protein [Candidatus Onthenecus intestinigallinarum]
MQNPFESIQKIYPDRILAFAGNIPKDPAEFPSAMGKRRNPDTPCIGIAAPLWQ